MDVFVKVHSKVRAHTLRYVEAERIIVYVWSQNDGANVDQWKILLLLLFWHPENALTYYLTDLLTPDFLFAILTLPLQKIFNSVNIFKCESMWEAIHEICPFSPLHGLVFHSNIEKHWKHKQTRPNDTNTFNSWFNFEHHGKMQTDQNIFNFYTLIFVEITIHVKIGMLDPKIIS